ncbi:MAG TPA: S9 family peptidase [Candidatus Aquabacterium excrementipullorum]|nr:S9 family peptidase [Candidatus Aquabacterium excrementipullorum]
MNRGVVATSHGQVTAWLTALGLSLLLIGPQAHGAEAPPVQATQASSLPTEAYARVPDISQLILSPNGQRIAGLLNVDDDTYLVARDVKEDKLKPVLKADNKSFSIGWAHWVGNERLVVSVRFPSRRGHVRVIESRLLSVPWTGGEPLNLVRSSPFDTSHQQVQLQDDVVDWLPGDGRHILVQMDADAGSLVPAVYKVDVTNGRREMVHSPRRHVHDWITDGNHRVRVGIRREEKNFEILVCDPDGQNWRTAWRFTLGAKEAVWPMGFGKNPNELYVQADHDGREAIFAVDLSSPDLKRTLKLAHPAQDVDGSLLRSVRTGDVVGVRATGGDDQRTDIWDPKLRQLALAIDKALPERNNRLLAFSEDETRYMVYSSGNGIPAEYYLGDRNTGDLFLLAETHPQLPPELLAGKRPVVITSRDGLPLRSYLTLPKAVGGRKTAVPPQPLPLVLLPHGGPQYRDDIDFDTWTEFLAARGYAVLQVNYRGSTGYGHAFVGAGLQRWGLEMQDDLTDAVQWAIARKIADPRRVCIVGGSYGGYAALMGVVKTPDLYRCAVSFAGVSDLIDLWNYKADFFGGAEAMDVQLGNAWRDRDRLRATSPALQAERIKAPILLVHGTADRTVPYEQSEDMANALRKAGKPYEFITLDEGDHYLRLNSHSLTFFKALERFLGQYLGPAADGSKPVAAVPATAPVN